ncbi:serine/threonine-protein kinase [Streptomyces sp. 891-h]|uniref:serine/threonine-protein kinase n=1 Tax=Streptomyces sp. 891-h TaxID=2720714 RepID=UPI001FAA5B34|nr:serine/threonine-protein kinase [Streptomyces sp. 891-h]UNZ17733.1 serine/threonine protein kinase [Streptomyces sp. 891-h]
MSEDAGRLVGGRYRLGGVLGRGGMGTVWRGEDEVLGRRVAVKELRFPSSVDEEEKQRLITRTLREAKAIARIRSGSAVTVFDVVNEDSRPWIVMELVEGRSLADKIKTDGPLDPQRAAEVGLAILDVLRAAHREGILHRDVKPSNVLLEDGTGRVVLTDFGIAKVEGDPSVTSTGMLVGAPSYISPERARGKPPGPPADLWSLGGLLFAAVEGRPPYDKGSAISTLTAVMTEPVPYPEHAGELSEVISGLLVKDPEKRLDVNGARLLLEPVAGGHKSPSGRAAREADGPAERTSILPPVPSSPSGSSSSSDPSAPSSSGSGGSRAGGPAYSSGTTGGRRKRRSEGSGSGERLRGAFKSVRNAAGAGGAAAGTGAAGTPGRTGTGSGTGPGSGSTGRREGSGGAASGTARSGPRHGGGSSGGAASSARASSVPPAPASPPSPAGPPASSPGRHSGRKSDGASGYGSGQGARTSSGTAADSGVAPGSGAPSGGGTTPGSGSGTGGPDAGGSGGGPLPGTGSGGRALPPESGGSGAITSLRDLRELPELRKGLSRRTLAIAAAALLAVILVIVLIVVNLGGEGGDSSKGGSGGTGTSAEGQGGDREAEEAGTAGQSDGKSGQDGDGEAADKADDGKPGDAKGDSALPDGYAKVSDGRFHFSVALPEGWKRAGIAGKNSGRKYAAPGGGYPRIQIDHTSSPGPDAAAAWHQLESAVKRSSPGYKSLGIKKVEWRGYPTVADWHFVRKENGKKVRVVNRGFKVDGKNGYAVLITCRADAWQDKACVTLRKTAFKTFRPRA